MNFLENIEGVLQRLISIPSVSPEGDPGTDQTGETVVAQWLSVGFEELGAEVSLQDARPGRPNLIATFKPRGEVRRRIALAPHLDTVSVAGMTVAPFGGELRDGRIYGRGACDTKGPAAAGIAAMTALARSGALPAEDTEWIFLGLAGEEDGSFGAQALCESGFKADLVIALEPTDNQVVCAHKGALWLKLKTTGRAAHGSAPQQGDNAVYTMVPALAALENLAREFARETHPLLGGASLNVGRITGGSRINVVPDGCEVWVDIRTHPQFTGNDALAAVRQAIGPAVQLDVLRNACPLEADSADPLVTKLLAESEGRTQADWFSDASVFAEHGIPAVVFGPGSIQQAHTAEEWIDIVELRRGAEILRRFMQAVC